MKWLKQFVCDWFHGGGTVQRDAEGRINWRCATCGRWSDNPVPLHDERDAIGATIVKLEAELAKAKAEGRREATK